MISKPSATCPRCGGKLTVLGILEVGLHAETVIYYAECGCGAAGLTVRHGQVVGIVRRDPMEVPGRREDPAAAYERYLADIGVRV